MPQTKTAVFEGKTYVVPADATNQEIIDFVESQVQTAPPLPKPQYPTIPDIETRIPQGLPDMSPANMSADALKGLLGLPKDLSSLQGAQAPSFGEMLKNSPANPLFAISQALSAAKGMGSSIVNAPGNLASGDPYKIGQGFAGVAAAVPVARGIKGGISAALEGLPSAARAGGNFSAAMGAAKDVPLNLGTADDAAIRALELAGKGSMPGRGSSLPKVVSDYIRQRQAAPEMTYEVGRDFATNAGALSATEKLNTNPVMKAQVSKLADALKTANREAAVKAGVGDLYDSAMKEYRQAMALQNTRQALAEALKKHGARAALTGAGLAGGYGLYRELTK